jgi:hypothetical protein
MLRIYNETAAGQKPKIKNKNKFTCLDPSLLQRILPKLLQLFH